MTANEIKSGSTERTDDQGTYTAYHRQCKFPDCNVELTSRNRAGNHLMCKACSAARASDRYRNKPKGAFDKVLMATKRADPVRTRAHHLLNDLLDRPTSADLKQSLQSYLMTLEIQALMRHLPNVAAPTSTNVG